MKFTCAYCEVETRSVPYAIETGDVIYRYCEQTCFRQGVAMLVEQNRSVTFTRANADGDSQFRWILTL